MGKKRRNAPPASTSSTQEKKKKPARSKPKKDALPQHPPTFQANQRVTRSTAHIPSPNKVTRQRRKDTAIPLYNNSTERERIEAIRTDFEDSEFKPCSIFGMNRHKEFPGFFFCGNCYFADSREQTKPHLPTNRKAKDGIFSCRAKHTMLDEPTYNKLSKNYHKKPTSRKPPPLDDLSTCLPTSDTSFPGSNIETTPRDVADHDKQFNAFCSRPGHNGTLGMAWERWVAFKRLILGREEWEKQCMNKTSNSKVIVYSWNVQRPFVNVSPKVIIFRWFGNGWHLRFVFLGDFL